MSDHFWEDLNQRIITCRACPRLTAYREKIAHERKRAYRDQEYWGRPVPGFGDQQARVLIVGLAPGAHGSNRTGRMFTGDASGVFLYRALHRAGFANQPNADDRDDGLVLKDVFITAICRCAPPDNKPTREEQQNCQPFLLRELALLDRLEGIVALGRIALDGILAAWRASGVATPKIDFGHNRWFEPGGGLPWLVTSYHPSRQNTQTGRLTEADFDAVWRRVRGLLERKG
ncbi:MAG: uracil-DNA glycosylase [Anaerolineaceae bacterium]|nr:uracil-DNA glycosylase [Anaerolineaceae bacterium]